jgi:hypothetical protein
VILLYCVSQIRCNAFKINVILIVI